ncbi:MAG: sodium:calcium symporter [Kiritimatiellales bacterium]|nr:sodium:calcium symporter [Kiritimatiellales bacterium]
MASLLVVWRLEVLSGKGVEGTVLGTIFMPFCSGMGNIVFALVLAANQGDGRDVLINCLFNNVTNLTVLIGAPVLIWSMASIPQRKTQAAMREHKMGRLSLVLNLVAALFFSLFVWLLAADGVVSRSDGFVLMALFVFWQCFHVYDVKKTNLLKKKAYPKTLPIEVVLLLLGAFAVFISTDWLVRWFQTLESGTARPHLLGWLSGLLMVLPNALLAFYYGAKNRMDVVYTSQSGDAHICVPLCIGIFAAFRPIATGEFLQHSLLILMGLCAVHLLFVAAAGRLPRVVAALFMAAFGWFLWSGLV